MSCSRDIWSLANKAHKPNVHTETAEIASTEMHWQVAVPTHFALVRNYLSFSLTLLTSHYNVWFLHNKLYSEWNTRTDTCLTASYLNTNDSRLLVLVDNYTRTQAISVFWVSPCIICIVTWSIKTTCSLFLFFADTFWSFVSQLY